jgi:hypothetical protein
MNTQHKTLRSVLTVRGGGRSSVGFNDGPVWGDGFGDAGKIPAVPKAAR